MFQYKLKKVRNNSAPIENEKFCSKNEKITLAFLMSVKIEQELITFSEMMSVSALKFFVVVKSVDYYQCGNKYVLNITSLKSMGENTPS